MSNEDEDEYYNVDELIEHIFEPITIKQHGSESLRKYIDYMMELRRNE